MVCHNIRQKHYDVAERIELLGRSVMVISPSRKGITISLKTWKYIAYIGRKTLIISEVATDKQQQTFGMKTATQLPQ